jgi:exopolysaccharide biosynthesis polyprenyl glycosylphosphotransferase
MAFGTTVINNELHSAALQSPTRPSTPSYGRVPWVHSIEISLDLFSVLLVTEIGFRLAALLTPFAVVINSTHHINSAALTFSCIMVMLLDRAGAYRASGGLLRVRETACVVESVFLAVLIVVPGLLLSHQLMWSLFALLEAPILAVLLVGQKYGLCATLSQLRGKGVGLHRVLIYGKGSSAGMLYSAMTRSPKLGFLPVAMACEETCDIPTQSELVKKDRSELTIHPCEIFHAGLVREHRAELVIIASPIASQATLQHVMSESTAAGARVVFGAEAYSMGPAEIDYIEMDGQLVYGVYETRTRHVHDIVSRTMDIVIGSVLLMFVAIPMALAALAILLDTRGPIFFRQTRIGLNGKPFTIFKFRTMHVRCCGDRVSPGNSSDSRITRAGKWLRRSSIDELPQLFNVLRGDMALVGPRPEMSFIVATYSDRQRQRLSVKPGLTGLWQISADRRYPIHENLHYDLYYLKHRSISMDVALLFHTLIFAAQGI